jgi:hypothetical protein
MLLRHAAILSLLTALAAGCATDNDEPESTAAPREHTGPLTGRAIEFALDVDALDHDAMNAIAKRIETQTGAESVSIQVKKSDDDGTTVVIETWGRATIGDDALAADLRAQFPALKNALITVKPIAGDGPAERLGDLDIDKDEDPAVVKQQVLEQLRAKGVKGDVDVVIEDHDDGKREVRVEVKDEKVAH